MADRKQFLGESAIDADLTRLLEKARQSSLDENQIHNQRVSFAYGNAPDSKFITKESVRKASSTIRLT